MKLRVIAIALAAAVLGGIGLTATPAPAANNPNLDILTANLMMLKPIGEGDFNNDTRATMIGNADWVYHHDIVVFQELFNNVPADNLLNKIRTVYPHQTPVVGRDSSGWDQTLGRSLTFIPEDGGVVIASRFPIVERVQYIYPDNCGIDGFSAKGFAYARLNVNGSLVSVIGTHTQADNDSCAKAARAQQIRDMHAFVASRDIPQSEPVIYAGDLNVDRLANTPERQFLLNTLHAATPDAFTGRSSTMDPINNDVAKFRYPNDPQQWLDWVLYDNDHAHQRLTNTALEVSSPAWTAQGHTFHRYSDHFPLTAKTGDPVFENPTDFGIFDHSFTESWIDVAGVTNPAAPTNLRLYLDIRHTYRGDLEINLVAPNGQVFLVQPREPGNSEDDIYGFRTIGLPNGVPANGTWKLRIEDQAGGDTGFINTWRVFF